MEMKVYVLERVMVSDKQMGHAQRNYIGALVQGTSLSDCRKKAYNNLRSRLGDGYIIRQVAFTTDKEMEAIIEPVGGPVRPQGAHTNVKLRRHTGAAGAF